MKFEQKRTGSFPIQTTFFPNKLWSSYKCTGKQTWPHHKKVKRQCTTIILANLVDLPSPMICANIQPQGILGSGEEDFYRFLPYMGMADILIKGPHHFSNLSFPQPKEDPYEICAKLAQWLQRRSRLKMLTDGWTNGRWTKSDHYSSSWA